MKIKVNTSKKFLKSARNLPIKIQQKYLQCFEWFLVNIHDPRLRTHKLTGRMEGKWAFWINYSIRVVFRYVSDNEVIFIDIGTHQVYK